MKNEIVENEITVECEDCSWITDLSMLSETNPTSCPKCGGVLIDVGSGNPIYS
jgi:Zn finger protein HypA/HybF involved in hydrogenase expression